MPIAMSRSRPQTALGRTLTILPLLAIPVIIYNLVVLMSGSPPADVDTLVSAAPQAATAFGNSVIDMTMLSGARLILTWGDMLLLVAIALLFVEVIKATHTGAQALSNHMLSIGLFVVCLIEFLLFENFATSVFFLLSAIVLIDGLAGIWVTTVSARRDFGVDEGFSS
jgi:hypothetical protein